MDKDLVNLKKWFDNLGLNIDDSVDDEVLKKLMPPQRRDMWRNIIKHVLPKEQVELIKKSILLHKLQKRQKPLMAKVECDDDYAKALKYEELITKYNDIQKDIIVAETNNTKIKDEINEKMQYKNNLIKNIEFKQNKCYLAKHQTEYYQKFIDQFNELSNMCRHFTPETNEVLTKTDYEDSLIKCLTKVDEVKQSGKMIENIKIGKNLSNFIFRSTSDKCPAILLQTIEENLMKHINDSNEIIESKEIDFEYHDDDENVFNESFGKIFQIQMELKSKLSSSATEKINTINHLKNTTQQVKNEILSQYKLRNIACTDDQLLAFQKTVGESLRFVIKNTIDSYSNSKTTGLEENAVLQEESFKMIDDIFRKTKDLNDEIFQKKVSVCNMLKELHNKKSDFGLADVKIDLDKLYVTYMNKIDNSSPINKTLTSINNFAFVDNTHQLVTAPKPSTIRFWNFKVLGHYSKIIQILSEVMTKFEQLDKVISTENIFNEIEQKENNHKSEFNNIISQMENKMLELDDIIENCELTATTVLTKHLQHLY